MTLGEKIKITRKEQGITQKELVGDKITRNMLSAIESDKASPSIETAKYLANRLSVPLSYLLSDDEDLFTCRKNLSITNIKYLYAQGNLSDCIKKILALGSTDDELAYILSECYYMLGKKFVMNGSLDSGQKHIDEALKYTEKTVYNTVHIKAGAILYTAIASNIQAPLLELKAAEYDTIYTEYSDIELFKYLVQENDYPFKNETFYNHSKARALIKDRKFHDALKILLEIDEQRNKSNYNAYSVFSIYADIERCYREIGDFERAYRFANKRLTLLEAFKQ